MILTNQLPSAAEPNASIINVTIGRSMLMAGAIIVCVLNARATPIMESFRLPGLFDPVLTLFNVNAIVWLAFAAMIAVAREDDGDQALRRGDGVVLALALLTAITPVATAGGVGALLVTVWLLATSQPDTTARRIAIVGLGLSSTLIIGRLFLMLMGDALLSADAQLVALMAGTDAQGNLVRFVDGTQFVIGDACSSVHNMSLAFLLWAAATQALKLPLTKRLAGFALLSLVGVVLVNIIRLTLIAWYPSDFDMLHTGWGAELLGWLSLFVAATIVAWGAHDAARRAL